MVGVGAFVTALITALLVSVYKVDDTSNNRKDAGDEAAIAQLANDTIAQVNPPQATALMRVTSFLKMIPHKGVLIASMASLVVFFVVAGLVVYYLEQNTIEWGSIKERAHLELEEKQRILREKEAARIRRANELAKKTAEQKKLEADQVNWNKFMALMINIALCVLGLVVIFKKLEAQNEKFASLKVGLGVLCLVGAFLYNASHLASGNYAPAIIGFVSFGSGISLGLMFSSKSILKAYTTVSHIEEIATAVCFLVGLGLMVTALVLCYVL